MTKVKICGITSKTEIEFLNKNLPDYIGFVFAESRRRVTPEKAAGLAAGLLPVVRRVGVFVDMEPEYAAEIASAVGLDALQLHGSEDARYIAALRGLLRPEVEIWKAVKMGAAQNECDSSFRVMKGADIFSAKVNGSEYEYEKLESCGADRLLLDTCTTNGFGGTGRIFDWSLAQQLKKRIRLPIILAGGLNPGNVHLATGQVSPYAVDTSSGVETDGKKDGEKIKKFIEAARGESI